RSLLFTTTPPPPPPLLPYTTLFRSRRLDPENPVGPSADTYGLRHLEPEIQECSLQQPHVASAGARPQRVSVADGRAEMRVRLERSEEHTSELRSDLVCRLLLEKKKD